MTVMKLFELLPCGIHITSAHDLWDLIKDTNLLNDFNEEDIRRSIKAIVGFHKRISQYGIEGTLALMNERGTEIDESDALHHCIHQIKSLEAAVV